MFDSRMIGNYISFLRKKMKLTQGQLAEELGVSHQAVSNWERGEAMPDISLLQSLARILRTTADKILASGDNNKVENESEADNAPEKKTDDEMKADTSKTNAQIDDQSNEYERVLIPDNGGGFKEAYILKSSIAPVPEEPVSIKNTVTSAEDKPINSKSAGKLKDKFSLEKIISLAPYLSEDTLDKVIKTLIESDDNGQVPIKAINSLAPYLSEDSLGLLVQRLRDKGSWKEIARLAPYLNEETLDRLVDGIDIKVDAGTVHSIAPFLSDKTLDKLADMIDIKADFGAVVSLAPYFSEKTLGRIVGKLDQTVDMQNIAALAPYIDEDTLNKLALSSIIDFYIE